MKFALAATVCCLLLIGHVDPCLAQKVDKVKQTQTIKLIERAGLARTQTPIEVTVRFEQAALKDGSAIRLQRADGGTKVPVAYQVLDVTSSTATDSFAPVPQSFVQLAFLADVPAGGTATFEVSLQGPAAQAPAGLKITGERVGKTLETGPALFEVHPPSGQLLAITPKLVNNDRLVFLQDPKRGPLPIHWNPDIWTTGGRWGHTSDWDRGIPFNPAAHKPDAPPAGSDKEHPFFYREWRGPLVYRLTRWGKMPFVPQSDVSVTYTFYAGSPLVRMQSLIDVREDLALHTIRNAELVFSRHQFDTAVWVAKDGKLHTAAAYDYRDPDKSFQEIVRLPADVPCVGFANERKGYGVALIHLGLTNVNRFSGAAADEQAHLYIRDWHEHGKGSRANFLYFVRPLVYREGYLPTTVRAGSSYAEQSALLVFRLGADAAKKYEELLRWQKSLANPLEVVVD